MKRMIPVFFALLLAGSDAFSPWEAHAYFNRGEVGLTVGETHLALLSGDAASVSAVANPMQEMQLPGCGMAECPQTCGEETGCLDENGECTCAGTEYTAYFAEITAMSSDASVASAVYDRGVVNIAAAGPGEAVITVTGRLRQYTEASRTISVTVAAAPAAALSAPAPAGGEAAPPSGEPAPVSGEPAPAAGETVNVRAVLPGVSPTPGVVITDIAGTPVATAPTGSLSADASADASAPAERDAAPESESALFSPVAAIAVLLLLVGLVLLFRRRRGQRTPENHD